LSRGVMLSRSKGCNSLNSSDCAASIRWGRPTLILA
jgi:hypothetical protein